MSGKEICGITRCSGRNTPGSLAFSAALTAGLRDGIGLEAAAAGTGAEDGGEADITEGWAQAAPVKATEITAARMEAEKADFMGHPAG